MSEPRKDPLEIALARLLGALLEGHGNPAKAFEEQAKRFGEQAEVFARQFGEKAEVQARRLGERIEAAARSAEVERARADAERAEREQRELARRAAKEERRQRRRARRAKGSKPPSPPPPRPVGLIFAATAAYLTWLAVTGPHWWLVFVAFGLGVGAMDILFKPRPALPAAEEGAEKKTESSEPEENQESSTAQTKAAPGAPEKADALLQARLTRVDAVCERLLGEIRTGPHLLREIVHRPEETVKSLRQACHELARRERELRVHLDPSDDVRLADERAALVNRLSREGDEVTRDRLTAALRELDAQLAQRASLATAASRLDAEQTRLVYTLENLHAQVLRVRTAEATGDAGANHGLRQSLDMLGDEIGAVAEALESVNRDPHAGRVRG